tara:strand:- start:389 stop:1102 length:714 start_codon:yes stop_codon:yes gene_type:complete
MALIHKGKVKSVYDVKDNDDQVVIQYHDKVTAGNGKRVDYPEGKGTVCCQISEWFFKYFEGEVLTHYISCPSPSHMLCRKLHMIPVEVICRNIATGSLVRDTTLKEGMVLDPPLIEFNLKDDEKDDPLLTDDRVSLMGYDPHTFRRRATEMNFHFKKIFSKMDIDVVDFKLEYGHDGRGGLYLADELSPDNMRLWKKGTKERFDKDLFRKGEGDIVEAYKYILNNLSYDVTNGTTND